MKLKPALIACFLAVTMISHSCNKASVDNPPSSKPPGKRTVSLFLGGDLKIMESPLPGGKKMNNYVMARTLRDSTIYAVDVRTTDLRPYAAGIFNSPDDIKIELPGDSGYVLSAAAFKRGSGFGLWYSWTGEKQFFGTPLNRMLENKMVYNATDSSFLRSFTYTRLFSSDTSSSAFISSFFPEMDSYAGKVYLHADSSGIVTIPMKRTAFGIKFSAANFTGGKLIVAYQTSMRMQTFTPENIDSSLRIYSADGFRNGDVITGWERIIFVLKWQKPDGTIVTLGQKELQPPKRNHMVTVHVTLPATSSTVNTGVTITFTETDWTSTDIINL